MGDGGFDKTSEEGVGALKASFEFRVELGAHHPWMVGEFGNLHEPAVGGEAAVDHAGLAKDVAVGVVELEAMAVAFLDFRHAVGRLCLGAGLELARPASQPHRPP